MQKAIFINLSLLFLFLFFNLHIADARSGCCSHHGGVCGCGCCDGTSLSAICAPYYPECNNTGSTTATAQESIPTKPPTATATYIPRYHPTLTLTPTPTVTPEPTSTPTPTKKLTPTKKPKPTVATKPAMQKQQSGSFWESIFNFFHF